MFLVQNHIDICLITKDTVLTSLKLFIGFLQSWLIAIRSIQMRKNSTERPLALESCKLPLRRPTAPKILHLLFVNKTVKSDQEETALKSSCVRSFKQPLGSSKDQNTLHLLFMKFMKTVNSDLVN